MEELKKNINSDEIIWSSIKIQLKDIFGEAEYSNWLKLLIFNKIEKNEKLEILHYFANNLQKMTDFGLIHGDIKRSNVVFDGI